MNYLRELLSFCAAFALGINAFLSVTLLPLFQHAIEKHREAVESAGVISNTTVNDYPKFLDAAYYNLATLVIPVCAFLVWLLFLRKNQGWTAQAVAWCAAVTWFGAFLWLGAK